MLTPVDGLDGVLRYNLAQTCPKDVSGKEVQAIKRFRSIIQLRYGDKIKIEVNITSAASAALVPQPLLLPLVENAIEYGYDATLWPLRICVEAKITEKGLIAPVENTAPRLSQKLDPSRAKKSA